MAPSALTIATSKPLTHHHFSNFKSPSSSPSFSCSCSCSSSSLPPPNEVKLSLNSKPAAKKSVYNVGVGLLVASVLALSPLDADATRIEYYATVGEPQCELNYAKSGLGYCDIAVGYGEEAPRAELINVSSILELNWVGFNFSSNCHLLITGKGYLIFTFFLLANVFILFKFGHF